MIVVLFYKIKAMHVQLSYFHWIFGRFLEVLPIRVLRNDFFDGDTLCFGVGFGSGVGFDCDVVDKIYLSWFVTWVIGAFDRLGVIEIEDLLNEVYFLTALEELFLLLGQPKLMSLRWLVLTVSHHCIRPNLHVQSLKTLPCEPLTFLITSSSLFLTFSAIKTSDCGCGSSVKLSCSLMVWLTSV